MCQKRPLPQCYKLRYCEIPKHRQVPGTANRAEVPSWGIALLLRFAPVQSFHCGQTPKHSNAQQGGFVLLTEGSQAQHGDQQGVIPPAAFIPGLSVMRQDVPVGRII